MTRSKIFNDPGKIFDEPFSRNAKLLYLFLRCICDETYNSVQCTRKEIGQKCGMHANSVTLAMNELCASGLIFEVRQGCNKPNVIYLEWGADDEN